MNYCETCFLLCEGPVCPRCGGKKLRAPLPDDYCFLTEREELWAGTLKEVLRDNGVPFTTQTVLGAGIALMVGCSLERHRFYVPYAELPHAQALTEELFGQSL